MFWLGTMDCFGNALWFVWFLLWIVLAMYCGLSCCLFNEWKKKVAGFKLPVACYNYVEGIKLPESVFI